MRFIMYSNRPIAITPQGGKQSFCTCGFSANKPYCDGKHKGAPAGAKPAQHDCKEGRRLLICDCGKSSLSPLCDGHHNHCNSL